MNNINKLFIGSVVVNCFLIIIFLCFILNFSDQQTFSRSLTENIQRLSTESHDARECEHRHPIEWMHRKKY